MIRLTSFLRGTMFSLLQKPARAHQVVPALFVLVAVFGSLFLLFGGGDSGFHVSPWRPGAGFPSKPGSNGRPASNSSHPPSERPPLPHHPIDDLIRDARLEFNGLLGKRSVTLDQAAARYRERRGRHPPPGFDKWFAAATEKDAVIVEEFFDHIHHDINPFWGLEPRAIRARAHKQSHTIAVRNGKVIPVTDEAEPPFRMRQWMKLVEKMMPHLPDLDMFVNHMDESRVMVPWDDINKMVAAEKQKRTTIAPSDAVQTYSGVADVEDAERYDPNWLHQDSHKFWDFVRDACPPDTTGRKVSSLPTFNDTIEFPLAPVPEYTRDGYIYNFTAAMDPCLQPHLRGMHGTFIEAISMSTTKQLMPVFGECKLPTNNELLIPSAMYLGDDERTDYSGGNFRGIPWAEKKDGLLWRGAASGARNKDDNWWHNHRHRFVQMLNGTTVAQLEAGDLSAAPSFRLPPPESDAFSIPSRQSGRLGEWVSSFSDVAFNTFICSPEERAPDGKKLKTCKHNDNFYTLANGIPFEKLYDYKYLPDVDGNSFSGRYRAFLLSTSVTLKSTIYAEWHDARLIPWVHFVPFDNSYMDIYGVMDYFLGGRDWEAERIARESARWAEKVLRKDDMLLYTWRLLLEYARVMDDKREKLGYVEDLLR